ncbi:hypothetical protein FRC04_011984 [Tulasnella sp. 424]|nr:hypothetical protein FRC04_011984 [Tulasnella sp. 424]KAG8971316.1 hypothetical protein FRC05_011308 [Tulasnella sp. 425]
MFTSDTSQNSMLVLSTLTALLSQLLSSYLHTAILLTPQGHLVAYSSDSSQITRSEDRIRVVIGLASEVWREGTKDAAPSEVNNDGEVVEGDAEVDEIDDEDEIGMLECELGRVLVYPIYASQPKSPSQTTPKASGSSPSTRQPILLLALNGTDDEPWGLMHTKARALGKYLSEPLASLGEKLIPGTSPANPRMRVGGMVWGR